MLASKVIDNDQVTVWDITLKPGQQGPATPKRYGRGDDLSGRRHHQKRWHGAQRDHDRKFGDAVFIAKGSNVRDTLVKGGSAHQEPAHQVVVWLKNVKPKTIANPTHYPTAWPRPGAVKTLENDRVAVWNYSWIKGRPAPTHFHIHQQVVAERI